MGLILSLYDVGKNRFVTSNNQTDLDNLDPDQLFYDYVADAFDYQPKSLALGSTWSSEGTQPVYRIPKTATNGEVAALFLNSGDFGILIEEGSGSTATSATTTVLLALSAVLIVTVVCYANQWVTRESLILMSVVFVIVLILRLVQKSNRALPFPTEPVNAPNAALQNRQRTLASHRFTGEFRPTSTVNVPRQLAKWAQAKIGSGDADQVFPPISEVVTQVEGVAGMTAQLVYKDGPLEMEKVTLQPGTLVPLHSHDLTWVAAFRTSGHMYYAGPDQKFKLWERSELIVPPGVKHAALSQDLVTFYTIHMSGESLLTADFILP